VKLQLIAIGKTDEQYIKTGIEIYQNRLKHYLPFEYEEIPDIKNTKNMSEAEQKIKEGELILKKVKPGDELFLLDNNGKEFTSVGLSQFIENKMVHCQSGIIFVIGGAYGFSESVYKKAKGKISLSKMTFSHQMVRIIALEQLYRAMTILKGEPYHHE